MNKREKLLEALRSGSCLKVIAGINNFDKENVLQIAKIADRSSASSVDISAEVEIISEVLETCPELPVFVSSVKPSELAKAEELGANVLELGNFEALYEDGIYYSSEEVLKLTEEILSFRTRALVSITIPGHLPIGEQIKLAQRLDELGVDIIQTEGASQVNPDASGILGQVQKASLTIANTIELRKVIQKAFILTASGITPDTAPLAISAGANGVGVGKYVNKLSSEIEMLAACKSLIESIQSKTFEKADLVC